MNEQGSVSVTLHDLIESKRRIAASKRRKELWYEHGEGQLECFVYKPKYCKELMEVSDWRVLVPRKIKEM